jgi:HK97 family phage major capsid protein
VPNVLAVAGIAFGKRELRPHRIARKTVKFSKDLLENSRIDVEGVVTERVALALSRAFDNWYMTGNGANQPLGLFTASNDGIGTARDVNTGLATGITADGLITIQDTLNDVYDANARWLFHKDAITLVRKLKDGNQQYLWQPGLSAGAPSVILGKPYITATNVPNTYTNGLYAGMYGDFSYHWIANAASLSVQRLVELYALTGQIGLLFDGMGIDAMPVLSEAFVRIKCAA